MQATTALTVRLHGHLTRDTLWAELARVEPLLAAQTQALIVDAEDMSGYDNDARSLFVDWNKRQRERIAAVAVVTNKPMYRVVITAMAVASSQRMAAFTSVHEAEQWLARQ